jgi:hypothetical protein
MVPTWYLGAVLFFRFPFRINAFPFSPSIRCLLHRSMVQSANLTVYFSCLNIISENDF